MMDYLWSTIMKFVLCLMIIALCVVSCAAFNKQLNLDNDNVAEEALEAAVENYFGLPPDSIDFTPGN